MLNIGDTLRDNRYKIIYEISTGSIAGVFLARDQVTRELFAIKVIERKPGEHEEFRKAFNAEAKALAQLQDDPHIARFEHFVVEEKYLFIVMEYVPGKTLAEFITASGRLDERDALKITRQVAEALQSAHDKGIIHSDLKPNNIMLKPDGLVKVLDFGMALDVSKVTSSHFRGTPAYMSPEQVDPATFGTPGIQSDIYSLGATLYEMLAGRPPFTGRTILELAKLITERTPPPPSNYREDILPDVDRLVMRCLEKNPFQRFQTPRELIEAIDRSGVEAEDIGCARLEQARRHNNREEWEQAKEWCSRVPRTSVCYEEAQTLLAQLELRIKEKRLKALEASLVVARNNEDWNRVNTLCRDILTLDPKHAQAQELLSGKGREPWRLPRLVSEQNPDGYPLVGYKTSIGRVPSAPPPDIDLSKEKGGKTVSRPHGWIIREPNGTWLLEVNAESRNETYVNKELVEKGAKRVIKDEDELEFGDVKLTFLTGSSRKSHGANSA